MEIALEFALDIQKLSNQGCTSGEEFQEKFLEIARQYGAMRDGNNILRFSDNSGVQFQHGQMKILPPTHVPEPDPNEFSELPILTVP